ncbi:site-specific integrase [Aeromonas veronii]|uniref:tyrosine-type recombinase/integrase n=1 Tax=Aeromonas veronii TaxID=654 RepID=UPI00285363FF|nr:site-specific integrase [Aeromonas veronii]MDR5013445.1 site-specific integrase [Aeromonas veronii]
MALSDAKLRKIAGKPYDGPTELPDGQGLSARISPAGHISFQYRYRHGQRARRMSLGAYGDVSLKEARERHAEARRILQTGSDPATVRMMEIRDRHAAVTVSDCLNAWLESPQAIRLVKLNQWRRLFDLHVVPVVGQFVVDEMTTQHWDKVFAPMQEDASTQAGILLGKLKEVLDYAQRRSMISSNILSSWKVKDVGTPIKSRSRYLSDDEIGQFWRAVDRTDMTDAHKIMMKLIMLTGCRGVEIRIAKKADFDLAKGLWRVSDDDSKTGIGFVRGLSQLACDLLAEAFAFFHDHVYVFPPARSLDDRPMAASVLLSLAKQVGKVMGVDDWGNHDLRRTMKTVMSRIGVHPHVSEKVLGHRLAGILAVYDQHDYLDEQRAALEQWAAHIAQCVDGNSLTSA